MKLVRVSIGLFLFMALINAKAEVFIFNPKPSSWEFFPDESGGKLVLFENKAYSSKISKNDWTDCNNKGFYRKFYSVIIDTNGNFICFSKDGKKELLPAEALSKSDIKYLSRSSMFPTFDVVVPILMTMIDGARESFEKNDTKHSLEVLKFIDIWCAKNKVELGYFDNSLPQPNYPSEPPGFSRSNPTEVKKYEKKMEDYHRLAELKSGIDTLLSGNYNDFVVEKERKEWAKKNPQAAAILALEERLKQVEIDAALSQQKTDKAIEEAARSKREMEHAIWQAGVDLDDARRREAQAIRAARRARE